MTQLAKPFYYCAKIDLQLLIALFLYIAMTTKQRVCNGTKLRMKINLRFFSTFGSNKGPSHFHRLSQAIRRCMLRKGFRGAVAYIDDFFIAAATYEECRKWMDILIKLLRKL